MNIDKNEMTLAYIHKDEPKYFSQFIKHFYDALLKFEKLGSPDVKKSKGGSYSGGEWGNANPSKHKGDSGDINFNNIVIPKRTK